MRRAKTFCKAAGCKNMADDSGYCADHFFMKEESTKERYARDRERRGNSTERGYDWQWHKYRNAYLSRPENKFCRLHFKGCTVLADVVDHIKPLALGGDKYDPNNLQPACNNCNVLKGRRVIRGTWVYGADVDGE